MLSSWVKAKWWSWRGRLKARRKDFSAALEYFQRVLGVFPDSSYALCYAGYCLDLQGQYDEATKFYDCALQIKPDYAYVHAQLGRIFLSRNKPQEAAESVIRAFRIDPKLEKRIACQLVLGSALGELGRVDEALLAYQRAASLDRKDVEAQAGIGWALSENGKYSDAEQPLRNAIKLDPNYACSYEYLGVVLRGLGRDEESISIWQRLIELKPESSNAHASLGWALGGVGRYKEALVSLKKALEIDPDFPAYYSIGLNHMYLNEYQDAIDAEEKAILLQPDAEAYCVMAAALVGLDEFDRAIRASQQSLELGPVLPQVVWQNLGLAYFETSQFQKAAASFEKVLQFDPTIPDAHLFLGLTCLKLGKHDAALEHCGFLHALDISKEQELQEAISQLLPR